MVDWSISSNQSQFWGSTILTTLKKILLVVPCPNFSHTPLVKTQHCSLGITGSATSAIIDTKVSTKSTATSLPCQHLHLQYYHINTSTLLTYNCHAHDRAPLILSLYMIYVSFLPHLILAHKNSEKKNLPSHGPIQWCHLFHYYNGQGSYYWYMVKVLIINWFSQVIYLLLKS